MGMYALEILVRKWGRGELTVEQAIGQMLLHLKELDESLRMLERRVHQRLRTDEEDAQKN
jgi:hypothetical protein